jgi:large subunit ribosomal protein L30
MRSRQRYVKEAHNNMAQNESTQLKITQVRGTVGARWKQRESLRTLGLKKIRQSVVREDNPQTRGLIKAVHHLIEVEEVS